MAALLGELFDGVHDVVQGLFRVTSARGFRFFSPRLSCGDIFDGFDEHQSAFRLELAVHSPMVLGRCYRQGRPRLRLRGSCAAAADDQV